MPVPLFPPAEPRCVPCGYNAVIILSMGYNALAMQVISQGGLYFVIEG